MHTFFIKKSLSTKKPKQETSPALKKNGNPVIERDMKGSINKDEPCDKNQEGSFPCKLLYLMNQ